MSSPFATATRNRASISAVPPPDEAGQALRRCTITDRLHNFRHPAGLRCERAADPEGLLIEEVADFVDDRQVGAQRSPADAHAEGGARPFVPLVRGRLDPRAAELHREPRQVDRIPSSVSESLEPTRRRVARFIEHQAAHGFSLWVVVEKASGRVVGDCGLVLVEWRGPDVEVAYCLARDCWGKGYATPGPTVR